MSRVVLVLSRVGWTRAPRVRWRARIWYSGFHTDRPARNPDFFCSWSLERPSARYPSWSLTTDDPGKLFATTERSTVQLRRSGFRATS